MSNSVAAPITPAPITYVSESSKEDQHIWLDHLRKNLPDETIVNYDNLSKSDRDAIEIAIVADPDPAKLDTLPNLKWVHSLWAGVEKMMAQLKNAPFDIVRLEDPEMALKMSEAVLAWTLYLHRDMPIYTKQQQDKIWKEQHHPRAFERHVGFVGLGNLGIKAATMLHDLGFQVSGWSRSLKSLEGIATFSGADGLEQMLRTVDIAVCLIPLTPATRHLINRERLSLMKADACLINFARGPIIDTEALLEALDTERLKHAVLDVFDEEPLSQLSPLWDHDRVTVLPHISGPTNRETASIIVAENIKNYRKTGAIPDGVNKALGY